MKKEIRIFFTALMFYTRIPCPKWVDHSEEYLNAATRYFPVIGWIVGSISSLVLIGSQFVLPLPVSVALSIVAGILITGAFHEDGFAEVCDGFGGGWKKQRILEIMKDSRVGAYGVTGIVCLLLLKLTLLNGVVLMMRDQPEEDLWKYGVIALIIVSAHSTSRFVAATFIFTHEYVRETEDSKIKPVAQKMNAVALIQTAFWGLLPMAALCYIQPWYGIAVAVLLLVKWFLGRYFTKWIGGYTGDCLGATQQVCEIFFYMSILVIFNSIKLLS